MPDEDGRGERGQKGGRFPFEKESSFQLKGNGVPFKLPFRGEGAAGAPPVGIETFERGCIEISQEVSMKEGLENTGGNEGRGTFGQGGEFKRYNDSCSAADERRRSVDEARMLADVIVEWNSTTRGLVKRRTAKSCAVDLVDGRTGKTVLELGLQPKPVCLKVGKVKLHTKWINLGKMTVVVESEGVHIMLSEALERDLRELACMLRNHGKAFNACQTGPKEGQREKQGKSHRQRDAIRRTERDDFVCQTAENDGFRQMQDRWRQQQKDLKLTDAQRKVVELVLAGRNVFFTGSAGTGKSMLLQTILRVCNQEDTFATATTGLAASLVGGTTINSFAGIGRAEGTLESLILRASRGEARQRWVRAKRIVIDEVSMLDADTFDKLEAIARAVRRDERPFGGIQLVLSGDFYQLPPVSRERETRFAFESKCWKACIQNVVELSTIFRQHDQVFANMLNDLRKGICSNETLKRLRKCSGLLQATGDGILPTRLCTHRADLQAANETHLRNLEGKSVDFKSIDSGPEATLNASCPAPAILSLKVGAQVLLNKTLGISQGLVNGSRGLVVGFTGSMCLPIVKFASGEQLTIGHETWVVVTTNAQIKRTQIPLQLAWALSVHKSQGMSLDRAVVSLDKVWEYGQAYVALSRVRSLSGLQIEGDFSRSSIKAHPKVQKFYEHLLIHQGEDTKS